MPLLDSSPYDAIVDTHDGIYKVQIKYTANEPRQGRKTVHIPLEGKSERYGLNSVDFFAVYSEYFAAFFVFPNTGSMKAIRLSLDGKNSIYFNNFDFNYSSS
jgi:hypothetical protein